MKENSTWVEFDWKYWQVVFLSFSPCPTHSRAFIALEVKTLGVQIVVNVAKR